MFGIHNINHSYDKALCSIGIKADAAVGGLVNQETQFALDTFGVKVPQIIDNAENKQFVLVDHSNYSQTIDGMNKARIVGIVDHHGSGDVVTSEQINVRSAPAGAAASLVCLSFNNFLEYKKNKKLALTFMKHVN